MSKWSEFYKDKAFSVEKRRSFATKYQPFLDTLRKYAQGKIVEWGCGTGIVSQLLGKRALLIDNDPDMLDLACLVSACFCPEYHALAIQADIREYRIEYPVDLSHSHGVLEHFNFKDRKKIIRNMRDCSDKVVCYVPTNRYIHKSFGDEGLMSVGTWKRLHHPKETIEFNEGKDLILIW